MTATAAGSGATPVVLSMPSPAPLAPRQRRTRRPAGRRAADPDRADTAAMYLADFLRIFATSPVDGLLLDEGPTPAADLMHPDAYRPVLNVADHYDGRS